MRFGNIRAVAFCTVVAAGLSAPSAFADNVVVAFEAPGLQTPTATNFYNTFSGPVVNGTYTTNFNGSLVTGVYTSTYPGGGVNNGQAASGVSIYPADQYGGAGGTGSYLVTQYLSSTTLTLSGLNGGQVNYFGLWFSALDSGNVLSFYNTAVSTTTPVFMYTSPDYVQQSGACPASPYCGNPNYTAANGYPAAIAPGDPTQQFAYLNITDLSGTFNEVVFSQVMGDSYGRFEADNNAVDTLPVGSTPEPSSLVLLGTGITAMAGAVRRRIRK